MVAVRTVLCLLAVATTFLIAKCDVSNRVVTVKPWPNCDDYKTACEKAKADGKIVVYAKAAAPNDNLLYAFSTIGVPSIVVARVTGADVDMHFNWDLLVNGSIEDFITINNTASTVEYKFGVAFTRLIEYNDIHDDADLSSEESLHNSTYWNIKDFDAFNWSIPAVDPLLPHSFIFNASSANNTLADNSDSVGNWSINFSFTVQKDSGRSNGLPSLKYGSNETVFDFVMSNYTPTFANSRFALETVLVSESTNTDMTLDTIQSIDDEYSPGVFKVVNWLSDPSQEDSSGFLQWKPVCYTSSGRSRSTGTMVKYYGLSGLENRHNTTSLLNSSIVFALFGADLYNGKSVTQATNISFGLSEDGFFAASNYTAWTAAIGYGTPPVDTISMTVIIIISAGLGLPVIILIFGGVFTFVRKARKRSQYEAINSDTVSSSQPVVN